MKPFPTIPRRSEIIDNHKQRGATAAAVLPIRYSRALLRAFDVPPSARTGREIRPDKVRQSVVSRTLFSCSERRTRKETCETI